MTKLIRVSKATDQNLLELIKLLNKSAPHLTHSKGGVVSKLVFEALKKEQRK